MKLLRKIYSATVGIPRELRLFCLSFFVIDRDEMLSKRFTCGSKVFWEKCEEFNIAVDDIEANKYFLEIIGRRRVPDRFIIELRNAYLIGPWAIPITQKGKIVLETSGNLRTLEGNIRRSGHRFGVTRIVFLALLIRLVHLVSFLPRIGTHYNLELFHLVPRHGPQLGQPNYSHWVFENLPQLKPFSPEMHETVKIYLGGFAKDWQALSLMMLGVPSDSVLVKKLPYISSVNKLLISRMAYVHTNGVENDPQGRRWVNQALRHGVKNMSLIKSNDDGNYPLNIAFCRRLCGRRTFGNINELDEVLERNGYSIIKPEIISEEEKINISFYAKKILGYPSGSALANIIYSSDAVVIDIIPSDHFVSVWFILTRELGFEYTPVFATAMSKDSDYRVNAEYLNEKLNCDKKC